MKKYISIIAASLLMVSCVDTIILPDDKTVDEDFWKTKADVALMVNGAYKSMLSDNVLARLIVWSGLRSDELLPNTSITGTRMEDLNDLTLANTKPDNEFATWGGLYSVINNCNIVLERAGGVMNEDPSYTQGDYLADCSQMKALRALCYFYLVRNFRDVPYTNTAFMSSSLDRNIPQSAPTTVLEYCLNDLIEAEGMALSASAYKDWRRVGYITRDAIQSLIADIYLWRASITHNASDYEQAITYCDKVIASKKQQHEPSKDETEVPEYPLAKGGKSFPAIFVIQNAEESIFELQFDGNQNASNTIQQYYFKTGSSNSASPYVYASSIFRSADEATAIYPKTTSGIDYRLSNTYKGETAVGGFNVVKIRKYVSKSTTEGNTTNSTENVSYDSHNKQNFIIYRLTDIMLMKAEALTALAQMAENNAADGATDAVLLESAFHLMQVVNARSLEKPADSLKWENYKTKKAADIEKMVLEERLRELAFEGKRWYDLLRYNYRHVTGVDYSTTLAEQYEQGRTFINNSQDMLILMKRKLGGKGDAVASKMATEPRLYLPVPQADLKVSNTLKQMPTYSMDESMSKN